MTYATEHADALADIAEAGAAATFSKTTNTQNASTGQVTATTATVAGSAVRVKGDPKRYAELNLIPREAITLLFAPTTYGQLPELGGTVVWASVTYTVRDVEPLAPDGTTIIARIVVSK